MDSPEVTFTLAYLVFAVCFVFTPNEFHAAGLTVQNLLSGWLGSEDAAFVPFHLRRTAATLLCHSLLPLGEAAPAGQPRPLLRRACWEVRRRPPPARRGPESAWAQLGRGAGPHPEGPRRGLSALRGAAGAGLQVTGTQVQNLGQGMPRLTMS